MDTAFDLAVQWTWVQWLTGKFLFWDLHLWMVQTTGTSESRLYIWLCNFSASQKHWGSFSVSAKAGCFAIKFPLTLRENYIRYHFHKWIWNTLYCLRAGIEGYNKIFFQYRRVLQCGTLTKRELGHFLGHRNKATVSSQNVVPHFWVWWLHR